LLYGVRGEKRKDINSLAENISVLSHLTYEISEIVEIDINPLMVLEEGCKVVDARMTLKEV